MTTLDRPGTCIDLPDTPKQRACQDIRHLPDRRIVRISGVYVHTCPNCKKETQFRVPRKWWRKCRG